MSAECTKTECRLDEATAELYKAAAENNEAAALSAEAAARLAEGGGGGGTSVTIDTIMPASPTDDHVPSTQLLKEQLDGKLSLAGGTVTGILRMKNPKVAADDNISHDIAIVPNANGQGLQVQFPGGATAMIRAKTGTLATVAELNAGLEKKQDKLIAGSGISIAEDGKTISATGGGGGGTSVTILAEWPETPDNTTVPGTKLVKDYVDGLVGDINAALEEV